MNSHYIMIIDAWLKVLILLEQTAYTVPVVMLSVSKNIETIKSITLKHKHLIADYIPVESILNLHSKRYIQNMDFVIYVIHDNLKKTGAIRNKLGILNYPWH
jgi:hypothetical protein